MSDTRRSDDPDAQRLPADDAALATLLRRQAKKIAKLERNQIGCNMQCTPTVVVDKPPKDPQCGVCYILYGTEGCMATPPGCEPDCRECVPDVMGSSRWEFALPDPTDPHGPLLYDATGEFYYAGAPRVQSLYWPDPFTGEQSISYTAQNFGVQHGLSSQIDFVSLELRRHDYFVYGDGLRVVVQAWAAGVDFFGTPFPPGWYWWIEWYVDPTGTGGTYIYQHYADDDPTFDGSTPPWGAPPFHDDFERGALGPDWLQLTYVADYIDVAAPLIIVGGAAVASADTTPGSPFPGSYASCMAKWHEEQGASQKIEVLVDTFFSSDEATEGTGGWVQLYAQAVDLPTDHSCQTAIFSHTAGQPDLGVFIEHVQLDGSRQTSGIRFPSDLVEPVRFRFEADPDGVCRAYVNDALAYASNGLVTLGQWVGIATDWPETDPKVRILEANGGSVGTDLRLESGEDGTFSWSLNGVVQHEGSVTPGAWLTDPTKIGLWTDMTTAGIGAIPPTIETATHVHDICINGSDDTGGGSGGGYCDTFDRANGPLGPDYSASPLTIVGGRVAIPVGASSDNYTRIQREITGSQSIEVSFTFTGFTDVLVWLTCAMPFDRTGISAYCRLFYSPFFVDGDGNTHLEQDTFQAIGLWTSGSFSGPFWDFYPETTNGDLVTVPTVTVKLEVTADHMATFSLNGAPVLTGMATGGPTGSEPLGPHIGFDIRDSGGDGIAPSGPPFLESVCITGDGAGGEGGAGTCGETPTAATWLSGGGNSNAWLRGGPKLRPEMRRERVRG